LAAEMLPAISGQKNPDFRIHGLHAPTVIECKRRLAFGAYTQAEAQHAEVLYYAIREPLFSHGRSWSVEADFTTELRDVRPEDFREDVEAALSLPGSDVCRPWGSLRTQPLSATVRTTPARIYSPTNLAAAFDWPEDQTDWDGIVCEILPQSEWLVDTVSYPTCLKWRSSSDIALTKKARGVGSLFGDAVQQIPPGEHGVIYICYPEGGRAAVADARTRHIIDGTDWHYHWSVSVPLFFIQRLYPRLLGGGNPDLIESTLIQLDVEMPRTMTQLYPRRVFTL
jgi:hypothetical protein